MANWDISYKPNDALRKLDGESAKYKMWADRIIDHLVRGNTHWRVLLKSLQTCQNPITRAWLSSQWTFGANGWDLSEKLENFLCTWVTDRIYSRRTQLAGGESETGNGFEMWRKLYIEHHGGAEAIKLGGIRRLQEWPKCTSTANLAQHLDGWLECLETHNQELLNAPNVLRSMILGIIPAEYEDEILVRPEIQSYLDIVEFCKKRITYKRQKQLAELTRKPPGDRINHLAEEDDERIPSRAMKLFGGKLKGVVPPPPAPREVPRPSKSEKRETSDATDSAAALRSASPSGRKAFKMKFRFAGCWHCGEKGHRRKANPAKNIAGCPKFDNPKRQNNGKVPEGYKGGYEKARDAAWDKFVKSKGSNINALETDGQADDDDEQSECSEVDSSTIVFGLKHETPASPSFCHPNAFGALEDSDEEEISEREHFQSDAQDLITTSDEELLDACRAQQLQACRAF